MYKEINIDKKKYLLTSDDDYLKNMNEDFEPHMVDLFKRIIQPNFRIADIGANIGLTAILFSELGEEVFAFEPVPTTYRFLVENISRNHIDNVLTLNYGLGNKDETTFITFSDSNRSGGFVSDQIRPSSGHITESIKIKKLDHVWSKYHDKLDFIKIDVEGFEGHVLEGGRNIILKNKPIVVLELNHWCLNAFRRITIPDFFDALREYFPYLYAVDIDNSLKNLCDKDEAYHVMHEHIVKFRYPNIVAGYDGNLRKLLLSI